MAPTTNTELEIPQDLFKLLSKAAGANNRTMEEEIIARLAATLDRGEMETIRLHHQPRCVVVCCPLIRGKVTHW